ncbi:acetolactate synthase small subunit [bacterium]|nr:acetolactate synthase small subunit [bacterium]
MKHTISVLVRNKFGVLARIAGLFSGRGYNIDSLCVGETQDPEYSSMTIVTHGEDAVIEQIDKQLNKLIDVVKVTDFHEREYVERELALIKVNTTSQTRGEVLQIVNIFRGKVVDISPKSLTIEVTGDESKIAAIIEMLKAFGIRELGRTGRVAMSRK